MPRFVAIGINHKYAPLEVRERLAYPDRRIPGALKALRERAGCDEAVLLSTCNRVEIYAFMDGDDVRNALLHGLAADHSLAPEYLEQYCYFHRGRDAVEHLMRVAGGLDSLVLGETQILSQVKKSYLLAQSENATGKALNTLFHHVFRTAKRLHHDTGISEGQLSVSATAVRFVNRVFEELGNKTALLVGAGEVGELTLTYLREAGIGRVIVVSRSIERARQVADRFGGDAVPFDLLLDYLPAADVVITQTAAEGRILERKHFKQSQRKRGFSSVFALDLAVPRDIAEDVTEIDGVYLYNVDDLEHVVAEHAMERSRELEACTSIIDEETERFMKGFPAYTLGPLISEIRRKSTAIKEYELERVLARLSELPPETKDEIATFAERLTNKLLHPQIQGLKGEALKGDDESVKRLADALGVDKEVNLPKLRRERRRAGKETP